MIRRATTRGLAAGLGLLALAAATAARADGPIEYNRDIRPILSENCFACHGPDSAARKADLRLDKREAAIELGALAPGDADGSELVFRVEADDPTVVMPPPKANKTLTDEQKALLRRWIAGGAEYQPHWSLIAPKRPELPAVKDQGWVRTPIDAFILAKLEAAGLSPAAEADRRTLARRLSLDLTGLPPDPAEVEAFVNDDAPNAYEKLVDRWLDSPQWGEHRGRYWLDAARYADTHGIHFDNFREMWAYRDWVIKALNANMPFDRFTVEQLAGDLLPNRTVDQQIASGFNRNNITTNEGGTIPEEYLVLYTRDRTETVSQVFLGMTAGCAVCHDHKFDPLSQREFYEMAAFFNNTTQNAMDGNIKDTPPTVFVPDPMDRDAWKALQTELADARKAVEDRKQAARPDFDKWLAQAGPDSLRALVPSADLRFHLPLDEADGNELHARVDGQPELVALPAGVDRDAGHVAAKAYKSQPGKVLVFDQVGDFDKDNAFSYGAWVKLPKAGLTGALMSRMDEGRDYRGWDLWIENGRFGTHIVNKWQDDALKVVSRDPVKPGEWHHLFVTYDGSGKAGGVKVYLDGKPQQTNVAADALKSTIRTDVPFKVAQRDRTARLDDLLIQDVRVYGRALPGAEVEKVAGGGRAAWLAAKPADQRTEGETNELFAWWLAAVDEPMGVARAKLAAVEEREASFRARGTLAHVMQEKTDEAMAYVLFRGDYDKRRDPVKPGTPEALPPMPDDLPRNRLGFAQWLLRPEHPLTARVTVNRFWQELFGVGLVRTAGDFGVTGEPPSHPELLDWMAVEFRESGWDIKKFFKMLVMSSTYRQSAAITPEKREKDAENRLLSRGPRFRMDAEMVRDYALEVSDLLVEKLGGPSVKPYQPTGVWEAVAMPESNTRNYKQDSGDKLYRRSLYTFWKRAAPPASMEIFNAPNRETCTVRRERTNTPLQALVTLNDPQFVEAARHLAQHAIRAADGTDDRLDFLARRLLSRPFREEELSVVRSSFDELAGYYKDHPKDAAELIAVGESKPDPALDPSTLAAWTMLTNELMNLDEVLNK